MSADWDQRACENARHFVDTSKLDWSDDEFFASGEQTVTDFILSDLENICQGRDPRQMRVLEIGCGAGRVTRALAKLFGEVVAVDISREMIARAQPAVRDFPNVQLYRNNGFDLSVIPQTVFDFAFSFIVFQHIPSHGIIENYIAAVAKLLRPGSLFKFQVQGHEHLEVTPGDSWVGVGFSEKKLRDIATLTGFEMRHSYGAGTQFLWLWFFRR